MCVSGSTLRNHAVSGTTSTLQKLRFNIYTFMCFRNRASDTALLKLHAVTCQKNYCNRCVLSCRHLLAWVSGWGVGANMVTFVIATVVSNFV